MDGSRIRKEKFADLEYPDRRARGLNGRVSFASMSKEILKTVEDDF